MTQHVTRAVLKGSVFAALLASATLLSPVNLSAPVQAAQDAIYGYQTLSFSEANVKAFRTMVAAEQNEVTVELNKKYADKPEKVTKNAAFIGYARIISGTDELLSRIKKEGASENLEHSFVRLQRLHYTILADRGNGSIEPKLKRNFKMLKNIVGKSMILNVPKMRDPEAPIGERAVELEAARLFRPGEKAPVKATELARMSALEISRLQPAADHPALSGKEPGNHYADFLAELTRLIKACEPKKLSSFNFDYARRVVFYDELKEDATSPKIRVKDRYGINWGLKWGDEVHTDVALTRLAIDLGGTYVDPKFYSGPGETILILDSPKKSKEGAVTSFAQLATNLLNSKFQFHAERYLLPGRELVKDAGGKILGHGIVDEAMLERESIDKKYLGAPYVLFKECQLSFFNPAVKRFGGIALSNVGAVGDRVARSSIVFNCWIKNKDMKDDNSRAALLFNPKTGEFDRTVEFQSDLGCTLGAMRPSGEINSFESSFVVNMINNIGFSMKPLYVPASWKACSWSDARWMALRIAKITRADLERCFADSGWPIFVQRLAIEKLISRRNELIEPFRLDLDGVKPIECDPKLTLTVKVDGKEYQPVRNGAIAAACPLVQKLEAGIHAEGLAAVISRKND